MAQTKTDLNTKNSVEDNVSNNHVSNLSGVLGGSRVVVDAIHPRFLSEDEKSPETASAATEENFCQECKMVFAVTTEAVRNHFRKIVHSSSISCPYCKGPVYEYYFEDEKKYAHECNSKPNKR